MNVFGLKLQWTAAFSGALAGIAGLLIIIMIDRGADNSCQQTNQAVPPASGYHQSTDKDDYVAWSKAAIQKNPQAAWAALKADTSWANLEKIAIFLAQWLAKDPTSAINAFGEFAREHPNLIGDVAVLCGEHCPSGKWSTIERIAKEMLTGLELKAFTLVVARGTSWDNPGAALIILESLGHPVVGDLRDAQFEVRGRVIESYAKHDFKSALNWMEQQRSWYAEWSYLCRAVASIGLDSIPESDLSRLLAKMPLPNGAAITAMMCAEGGRNRTAVLKLVKALDSAETKEDDTERRSGVISTLAEYVPEIFDSRYFNDANAKDAYFVGRERKGRTLGDNLIWAESLGSSGAEDQAIRGIVHGMMIDNSYMGSQQIGKLENGSPQKKIAVQAMVEWLTNNGNVREAELWRSHLELSR